MQLCCPTHGPAAAAPTSSAGELHPPVTGQPTQPGAQQHLERPMAAATAEAAPDGAARRQEPAALGGVREQLQALERSVAELDGNAGQLQLALQASRAVSPPVQQQQQAQQAHPEGGAADGHHSAALLQDLQQQLAAMAAEKQRVEADRQEMAVKQGNYKAVIAQLEGALNFSERKVKDQLAAMEKLQAQVAGLKAELQEARGAAALTPDRCRTAARALQEEAERAAKYARSNEAQVKKLRQIVETDARELSELLEFTEQERLTLLDKEAALQEALAQAQARAAAADTTAADALDSAAGLEQQLAATRGELAACQERALQLEGQLREAEGRLQQAEARSAMLAAERDAAARNLLRAEAELNDVGEYTTKMFRQVRFISHMLDKNAPLVGRLPDFAALARDLRAFVAANASNWERSRDADGASGGGRAVSSAAPGGTAAATASHLADTSFSGSRDVPGKAGC